jgi:tyrosine-protein kinase Etk/Wzc
VHSPAVEQLSNSLLNLEATRDSMTTGPFARAFTNPDVRRNDELMATTLAQLLVAVRNQMADLDEQIDRLSLSADISRRVQAAVPAREARETQLTEAEMTRRKMADQLREEYQRAQIAEAAEAGQVEIVDLAVLPTRAANAGKARLILFGAMGGVMLGLVLAYVREQFNTLLRRVSDVETVLDVPALALIPAVGVSSRRFGRSRQGTPPAIANSLGTTLSKRSPPPAIIAGSGSVTSEAFRALRTNLLFSHGGRTLRVLTVTSPLASEGKTTVAVNLAVSFAQQGLRVALIDCDLRRPSVHKVFSLPREPGMTELVQGEVSLEQVVHPTDYAKLFVIMAGRLPSNPAELLGSAEMRQVLETLATTFEVLIIDTPPVLLTSDAAVLSAVADGVLLVVRAGRTERAQGRGAVRQLHTVGARVVGAVLNDPDRKMVDDPGFAYGYGYEYAAAVDTKE